jgi:hypothetical protein
LTGWLGAGMTHPLFIGLPSLGPEGATDFHRLNRGTHWNALPACRRFALKAAGRRRSLNGLLREKGLAGLTDLDQVPIRFAEIAADLGAAILRRREELRSPRAPVGIDLLDVRDADVEKAAYAVPPGGVSSVTVGLSSVGPPPTLMMIQLFASATNDGSPSRTVSPPSTSV